MKNIFLFLTLLVLSISASAQKNQTQKDSTKVQQLKEILLSATRARDKTPIAFSNISKEALESTNLGQDLPILLDQLPSVVTTSDAGAGVGYTGIRVRGTDATRVNVTINGIPYNDSESQGTFWVNMPDFVSSVEDIQLQRGVGTSTNGSGAFGASLNIKTLEPSEKGYASTSNVIGSFGTRKHNINFGSGLKNNFYAEGRLSKIMSDGYIDRATSDLSSFYVEGGFLNKKTSVKAIVFGGKEETYQSWYGTPEAVVNGDVAGIQAFIDRNFSSQAEADNLLNSGRTYNYYTYDNEVDHYEQTHYQLHVSHQFNAHFSANISGNYTRGKGYFEQYKDDEELGDYFPNSADSAEEGDVIRRRWLDNDFYAFVYAFNYKKNNLNLYLGGGYNKYDGNHFGELIWDSFPVPVPIRTDYYTSIGKKRDYNSYLKAEYTINSNWFAFADVQFRRVDYESSGVSSDLQSIAVKETYDFFNPKLGLTYTFDNNTIYGSLAIANREPNRDDLTKNPVLPKPERLFDYEFGYKLKTPRYYTTVNLYFMDYKDQLVLTGDLDNVGDPIRENVVESYRAGMELQVGYKLSNKLRLDANATFSQNKIKDLDYVVYDTQYDPNTFDTVSYEAFTTAYEDTDISFSPSIIAGGTLSYSPVKNLGLRFISKYVGKQYLDNTSSESKSMDAYFVNNFNASYKLQPSWIKEIAFNLLVNNIFNNEYVSNGYTYSYYYRPQGSTDEAVTENFYYPQATTNFLMGVTLKF